QRDLDEQQREQRDPQEGAPDVLSEQQGRATGHVPPTNTNRGRSTSVRSARFRPRRPRTTTWGRGSTVNVGSSPTAPATQLCVPRAVHDQLDDEEAEAEGPPCCMYAYYCRPRADQKTA